MNQSIIHRLKWLGIALLSLLFVMPQSVHSQCNVNTSICVSGTAGPFNFVAKGPAVSTCLDWTGPNVAYIMLNISTSGPLNMLIQGNTSFGFLDVAVFNVPTGVAPCTAIQNTANQLGCNYAAAAGGCNQFGNFYSCTSSVPAPNVTAGQNIMIVVENWSGLQGGSPTSFTLSLAPTGAQAGLPNATITPSGPVCNNTPAYQLVAADAGGVWSGPGTSSTGIFTPASAGVGTHTINYTVGVSPCIASSSTTITVYAAPATPSIPPQNRCGAGSVTLSGSPGSLGLTFRWYSAASGGPLLLTGTSYTAVYSATTTVYVSQYNPTTGCESARVPVVVTVNSLSTQPSSIAGTTTICAGGTTTLTQIGGALGTGAAYQWFSGGCASTSVGTGNSIIVAPTATTTYFVRAAGTCNTTNCTSFTVFVDQFTTANAGPNQTVCSSSASLAGNLPTTGTGVWTVVGGSGTITSPSNPSTTVTGLGLGNTTLRWTLLNGVCNDSQDDVVISRDNVPPSVSCPPNQNVAGNPCNTVVTYAAPSASDNCAIASVSSSPPSGSVFSLGTTTVVGVATDVNGNTASCTFTVTVRDVTPPSISCPANISVSASPGLCTGVATFTSPSGTDACSGTTVAQVGGLGSGATYPTGVTTNTFRATDGAGNSSTCSFTVTVVDNQAPTINCPANINVNAGSGLCAVTVSYANPTIGDNCPGATLSLVSGAPSGASFPVGVTTNTYRVTAANGASTTCSFTVTVVDNQAPTIACPTNINVNAASGLCAASVSYSPPTGGDNCPGATTTQIGGSPSGASFPVGVTTNTFRVTAANGASTTCSFTVTVVDNQAPTIACPANINVNAASGLCAASVSYSPPTGGDNCPGATTTQIGGSPSGASFPVGVTTNTFRVTAANGASTTCSFTVTVVDNQAPTIACPANINVNAATGLCAASVSYSPPTGGDNCPGATTTQIGGSPSGASFPVGVTTNTFRVTAANGASTTCSFTVTVVDNQAPTIACPTNINVNAATGLCAATVSYPSPTIADNCPGATLGQIAGSPSGTSFPVGVTTNTFRVTAANGATATCSFSVTVVDNQAPTIICPANLTVNNTPGNCNGIASFTVPVGTDNCAGATTVQTSGLGSGVTYPFGTTSNSYLVTDATGATATCSFNVTVVDNESPVVICPANITVNNAPGLCDGPVTVPSPTASDNCSALTLGNGLNFDGVDDIAQIQSTSTINTVDQSRRTVEVYFRVNDKNINTRKQVVWEEGGQINGLNIYVYNGLLYYGIYSGGNGWNGTWVSTPLIQSGQWHNAVLVYDGNITNQRLKAYLDGVLVASANASASLGVELNVHPGDNAVGGLYTNGKFHDGAVILANGHYFGGDIDEIRLWTIARTGVELASTNTVQLIGNEPGLVLYYPMDQGIVCGNNPTVNFMDDFTATALDGTLANFALTGGCNSNWTNGSPALSSALTLTNSYTGNASASSTYPVGTTAVTYTATDESGNTGTCTFTVTVVDNELPTITCPANVTVSNDPGLCSAVVSYATPSGSDNCPGQTTVRTAGLASASTFPLGTTTNSYVVTAANGQSATCSFNVTVNSAEINVTGNAVAIVDGDLTPSLTDHTDFGTPFPGVPVTRTYTIQNNGSIPLTVNTITMGGANASNFTVGGITLPATVAPSGSTTFTVTFLASPIGVYNATVLINNSDCNESPFDFAVRGEVSCLPPAFTTCIQNVAVTAANGTCARVVTYLPVVTGAPTPTLTYTLSGATTGSGSGSGSGTSFNVGVTTITLSASNPCGTATCVFTITVSDTQVPLLNGVPANATVSCDNIPTPAIVTATDNCPGLGAVDFTQVVGGAPLNGLLTQWLFNEGSGTTTADASGNGNTGTLSPNVIWTPGMNGTAVTFPGTGNDYVEFPNGTGGPLDAPNSISLFARYWPGTNGSVQMPIIQYNPGGWGVHLWQTGPNQLFVRFTVRGSLAFTTGLAANVLIPNTWNCVGATYDFASGMANLWHNGVNVASLNIGQIQLATNHPVRIGSVDFDGRRTDGKVENALIYNRALNATEVGNLCDNGSCPQNYQITRNWTVTDGSGNSASAGQTITVQDVTPPVVTCPTNIAVNTTLNQCGAAVSYQATASDNCSNLVTVTQAPASSSIFSVGTTIVAVTAADQCGNTSTCSFTVTVSDVQAPNAICQPVTVQLNSAGNGSTTASAVNNGSNDACGIVATTLNNSSFTCANVGANTVILTVTDVNGNSSTCSATVTVQDNVAPVAICQNLTINLGSSGSQTVLASSIDNGSNDACGIATTTLNPNTFTCDDLGVNNVILTVTDVNANSSTCAATVTVTNDPLVATTTSPTVACGYNVTCNGATNGSATVTSNGGCLPYAFLWSNGQTTATASGLGAGTYTVTVTDANGNTVTSSLTLTEPTVLTSATSSPVYSGGWNVTCNGANDGSIDLTVGGGASCLNYTFVWSNGATTEDLSNIGAGTYTVTVTDANGCSSTSSITLTQPATLSTNLIPQVYQGGWNVSCNGASDGSIFANVSGGTPAFSYVWSNGATTQMVTGLGAGTYSVTVTDQNGCFTVNSVTLTEPTLMTDAISAAVRNCGYNVSCNGATDGSIDYTVMGGTAPYIFAWSNGATTEDISGLAAGNYSVTATDRNGCSTTSSITLTQPALLTADIVLGTYICGTNVSCNGASDGSAVVNVTGGCGPYTYDWGTLGTSGTINGLPAIAVAVTVTDANGCQVFASDELTEPALLVSSGVAATYVCGTNVSCNGANDGSINLTVTGGASCTAYTFNWSNGATTEDVSNLTAGNYSVTITDANGCSTSSSFTLTEPALLVSSGVAATYVCGTNVSLQRRQ